MTSSRLFGMKAILATGLFVGASAGHAAAANGDVVFKQRCAICHSVDAAAKPGVGPNLRGVVGRKAAKASFTYSPALTNSNLTWNKATLDRYLTAPAKLVPGTRMVISVTDPAQRAAIIQYLSKAR